MPPTATIDRPIDERLLDELVPPPGPRWRRAVGWVAFLAIVGVLTWAIASGTVVPHVSTQVNAWGGNGPVGVTLTIDNDSPVAVEIVDGPGAQPGLRLLGYTTGSAVNPTYEPAKQPTDPFPLRLEPRSSIGLTAWYEITDCDAIRATSPDHDQIGLQVRIADGPASRFTFDRPVDAESLSTLGPRHVSWTGAIADFPCRP